MSTITSRRSGCPPRVLSIAGSDSGGGAGIQADLKTIAAFECYGTTAITAITSQNTLGVHGVQGISAEIVAGQIESVLSDIGTDAIKTGMLFSTQVIQSVVATLEKMYKSERQAMSLVLDPVCVSTSGHELLPHSAVESLKSELLPLATIITPNIPEAEFLTGRSKGNIQSCEDMRGCAKELSKLGVRWVYLKGGHLPQEIEGRKVVLDLLWDGQEGKEVIYKRKWSDSPNTHGTGCTLAAAIACGLAKGQSVPEAVRLAGEFVAAAIDSAYPVGQGAGPVNHSHAFLRRSLPLPTPSNPTPFTDFLIGYDAESWRAYVNHPFPNGLAAGTMPLESFLEFIRQDFHFLIHYARTNSLTAYKTESIAEMSASNLIVETVLKETEMHVAYCNKYGITREELMNTPESVSNLAYNRYVLDTCNKGDLLDCRVVTAPCLIGYGQVGARLVAAQSGVESNEDLNPYWGWIKEYGSDWYQNAVKTGIDLLERTVADSPLSEQRLHQVAEIFVQATKLEIAFWAAAIAAGQVSK